MSIKLETLNSGGRRAQAKQFLAAQIEGVKLDQIGDSEADRISLGCRQALSQLGLGLPKHDVWRAVWSKRDPLAVIHAGPQWGQIEDLIGHPSTTWPWVSRYVRRCWNVDEIAVHPDYRHRGYGSALLDDLHEQAAAAGVRTLTAFATSSASIALFTKAGWTALPPQTPIPPQLAEGLKTLFIPELIGVGATTGAWVYRQIGTTQ